MKEITFKEYLDKFFGLKGFIKYGHKVFSKGTIDFTPARGFLEIKLSHQFTVVYTYSKRHDVTTMFICDNGYIDFGFDEANKKGIVYKVPGKLANNWYEDEQFDTIFNKLYVKKDLEMREIA